MKSVTLYADFNDGHQIVLTTGSHKLEEAVNIIYLEPEVYQALVEWMDVIQQEAVDGGRA